jgi:hypothetical protein
VRPLPARWFMVVLPPHPPVGRCPARKTSPEPVSSKRGRPEVCLALFAVRV